MRLLDVCCKAGGTSKGYTDAGFEVVGVDIEPQPRYPYEFVQADALDVLADLAYLATFDAVAASFPCQRHTLSQRIRGREHPDLIEPGRKLLRESGLPYVIENVPGAPLHHPVELCGAMFGLRTYRHRWFESNLPLTVPSHPEHAHRTTKMGRPPRPDEYMHIVGNFSGAAEAREVMGCPWMTRDELREAIPPAYTRHLGAQLAAALTVGSR